MRFPFVSAAYMDVIASERDRILRENADLRSQVKKLTDAIAGVNRIPPPYRETPLRGIAKVSTAVGVFQRQKMLERKRQGISD